MNGKRYSQEQIFYPHHAQQGAIRAPEGRLPRPNHRQQPLLLSVARSRIVAEWRCFSMIFAVPFVSLW